LGRRAVLVVGIVSALAAGGLYGHSLVSDAKSQSKTGNAIQKAARQNAAPDKAKPLDSSSFSSVIDKSKVAVVKVESEGCGFIYDGTGFVVAPGLIATNAHVVAGTSESTILTEDGSYRGKAILFDPELDFAIIRADNMTTQPLPLDNPSTGIAIRNTHLQEQAIVLGYPGGGSFTSTLATIDDDYSAISYNIYGKLSTERDIFSLDSKIIPGYSGSPVVGIDGIVLGIVYGVDPRNAQKGLALPIYDMRNIIEHAKDGHVPASTGTCVVS